MPYSRARLGRWFFGLAILVFPLLWQGSRGLLEPDEGRYAEIARAMLADGDWLTPRLAGEPHYDKPPVTYWLTAAGLALAGRNAWGARLALGLCYGATALLAGRLAARLWGRPAFRTGALVYLLSLGPFVAGGILTTDTFLTLWEAAGVLAFLEAWSAPQGGRAWVWGMWLAFGAAFLTKGPPGLLPLLALLVFLAWRGRGRRRRFFQPAAILAGVALGLSWYAVVHARTPGLAEWFVKREVWERVATARHHRNNPWIIYPPTLFLGCLPWALWVPRATGGWRSLARRAGRHWRQRHDDRVVLLALWLAVPLAFFVLARSRLPLYVMPLWLPLGLVMTGLLHENAGQALAAVTVPERRAEPVPGFRRLAAIGALALLALKIGAAHYPWPQDMRSLDAAISRCAPPASAVVALGPRPLNGLRFYRRGGVENWRGDQPVPVGPPAPLAVRVREEAAAAARDGRPRVFVARQGDPWAASALARAGLGVAGTHRDYSLYVAGRGAR